jgi:hypothetical protein
MIFFDHKYELISIFYILYFIYKITLILSLVYTKYLNVRISKFCVVIYSSGSCEFNDK